ncbi:MAG: serine--tRNA ligase, partial [Candidatus Thermoplasmatota archaeon]|nr:serine--tRNA ligase [Candidatus Thermoplasmatota archaeon]
MLDMQVFREEVEKIRADHDRRGLPHDNIDRVLALDSQWKLMLRETNELRRQKNEAARGIGAAKKSGDETEAQRILSEVADLGAQISEMEKKTDALLSERDSVRMSIPNLLHPDVPSGADESGNTKHSLHGEKPSFDFEPKTHNELIEANKWVDLESAAKITGSRFY